MQEHLIVDGNNALHAIPEFARELKLDRARARESLLHFLEPLQAMGGCLLSVVFDGKGGPQSVSKHRGIEGYTVIYSSSVEGADGVIERMLMGATQPERIVVVTNDGLIRNCAYAHGSTAMRVEEVAKRLDYAIESSKSIRKDSKPASRPFDSFENKIPFPD
jgi:predicted RNA-binding protein with PIN domain|tara:strand:- start:3891 stop:4376 length:486 start_codon:yes stop_codon:yes gene_type:complete